MPGFRSDDGGTGGPTAWFFRLFGFHEKDYDSTISRLEFDDEARTITSVVNEKPYRVGRFETPSLAELQARYLQRE